MKFGVNSEAVYRNFNRYYYFFVIFASLCFVVFFSIYRIFFAKPSYIYVRAIVKQGLWWTPATKPISWIITNVKKGFVTKDTIGQPVAKILSARSYPLPGKNQKDIFLVLKIKANYNLSLKKYIFNRSAVEVSLPIDFHSPTVNFTAVVVEISEKPLNDKYTEKTVFLTKKNVPISEYDTAKIGDYYFDGEEKVFEILDKKIIKSEGPEKTEIEIKAKVKGRFIDGDFVFAENQIIKLNKKADFYTDDTILNNYTITSFE